MFENIFLNFSGNSLLSTSVLLSPKMCDGGDASEPELALRRADFFQ